MCRGAYLRLHNISRIRRYITEDATKTLIQAFVISKLDCGNALLTGVSCNLLRKLQRVQNMAARVITFTPRREHISPVLRSLHWLPIHRRIEFKILLLVYLCLNDVAPQYLAEMWTTHAATRSFDRVINNYLLCRGANSNDMAIAHLMLSRPFYGTHYQNL